jgi:hypothetical protein
MLKLNVAMGLDLKTVPNQSNDIDNQILKKKINEIFSPFVQN